MEPRDEQLRPKHIDAQIDTLIQFTQEETPEKHQSAQLIQRLQHHYESERQQVILARAWRSIVQKYEDESLLGAKAEQFQATQIKMKESGQYCMQYQGTRIPSKKGSFPLWGTLLAVAVLILVIGSATVILRGAAQQRGKSASGGGTVPICQVTATPAPTIVPIVTPTIVPNLPSGSIIATPTPSADGSTLPVPTASPTCATPTPSGPAPTAAPTRVVPIPTPSQHKPTPSPTIIPSPTPTIIPLPTSTIIPTQAP